MKLAASLLASSGIALFALLPLRSAGGSHAASVAQAAAAPGGSWSAPATVTRSGASRFSIAVNARGDEVFVWEAERVRSSAPRRQQTFIRTRVRSHTGRFMRTHTIPGSVGGVLPDVDLAPDGTAIVAWTQPIRGHYRIVAAVRRPGRQFGRPRRIGRTAKFLGALPQVGFDRKRNAIVLWRHGESLQWVYRARGHGFGRPQTLRVNATEKRLVFDRRGNAYVLFASPGTQRRLPNGRLETTEPEGIFLATRRPGGSFRRPQRVSPTGAPASQPDLAIGADRTIVTVWRRSQTGVSEDLPGPIEAAVRPSRGRFGPPQTLTGPQPGLATSPQVVVTPAGEAVAAWQQSPSNAPGCPDCSEIEASVRPPGGTFGPGQRVSPQQVGIDRLSLAEIARGDVLALWQQPGAGAVSAVRTPGGTFTTGEPISSTPAPLVGVASAGNRVAVLVGPGQVVSWSLEPG